ncbi:DUF1499 domain-containing protein [Hellea balneolensis]|uniref:DUF1499 domain-containing protein n=1 Tax=Hellea balneolensis TaxID=287478 RepID=UPI00041550ED|nr:DUF1499 domain-containing protein [Hellea balneolensis]
MSSELVNVSQPEKGVKRRKLRHWYLKLVLALAIFVPLFFLISTLGVKFGFWDWTVGLGLNVKYAPVLLPLLALSGLIGLLLSFIIQPRKGFAVSLAALIIGAAGLGHGAKVKKTAGSLPFIHDITTDTQDVPTFTVAIMSERAQVKGVNTVEYVGKKDKEGGTLVSVLQSQAEAYADIRPLILQDAPNVVFGEAKAAAKQMGWVIKSENVDAGLIEATDTTFWYGFKDDVVIRIRPSEGGGTVLDVRSVSRVGGSDIGANADRIRGFLKIMSNA